MTPEASCMTAAAQAISCWSFKRMGADNGDVKSFCGMFAHLFLIGPVARLLGRLHLLLKFLCNLILLSATLLVHLLKLQTAPGILSCCEQITALRFLASHHGCTVCFSKWEKQRLAAS